MRREQKNQHRLLHSGIFAAPQPTVNLEGERALPLPWLRIPQTNPRRRVATISKNRFKREVEKSLTDSDVDALQFVLPRLRFPALPRFHRIVMRNRLRCTECSRWCGFRENQVLLFCCCSCFGFRFFEELLCGCSCCVCCCCFRVLKKKLCCAVAVVIVFFCFWEELLLCCVSLELTE